MRTTMYISIVSGGKKLLLNRERILYVLMVGRNAEIHLSDKTVYETRKSLSELEEKLGDSFLEIHRGCIVATMAIHSITDKVYLSNGEVLIYTLRKKKQIIQQLEEKQCAYIEKISRSKNPTTEEEYRSYYKSFEKLPFAFTDIEMIFDVEHHAVDWLFRYGNQALAELEKCRWSSCWNTPSVRCSEIWTPNGCVPMSVQRSTVKPLRSLIIARKLIPT